MKLLIDQALSPLVADAMRALGHDVIHTRDRGMERATDSALMQLALSEQRVLVSADADFGEHLWLGRMHGPSVIRFRGSGAQAVRAQIRLLGQVLAQHQDSILRGALLIVDAGMVRVRDLPLGS